MSFRLAAPLCSILALSLCACDQNGAEKKTGPDRPGTRKDAKTYATPGELGVAASNLTSQAQLVVTARSIADAVEATRAVMGIEDDPKAWDAIMTPVIEQLGGDPLDVALYERAGVDMKRPVLMSFGEDAEAAIALPISDASKWRTFLEKDLGEKLEADTVLIGDVTRIGRRSAYVIVGDYACIARYKEIAVYCTGASRAGGMPLADDPSFATFAASVSASEATLSAFAAPRGELFSELVRDLPRRDIDPMRAAKVLGSLTGFGSAATLSDGGVDVTLYAGIERGPAERASALLTAPKKLDMSGRVGPEALALARFAFDPMKTGVAALDMIDADSYSEIEEGLAELREDATLSIRLREDAFARSGGHALFALYPSTEVEGKEPSELDPPGAAFAAFLDTASPEATSDIEKLVVLAVGLSEAGTISKLDDGKITLFTLEEEDAPSILIGYDGIVLASPVLAQRHAIELLKGGAEPLSGDLAKAAKAEHSLFALPRQIAKGAKIEGSDRALIGFLPERSFFQVTPGKDGLVSTGSYSPANLMSNLPKQIARDARRGKIYEADQYSRMMVDGCRAYMNSNQRHAGPYGGQPWHVVDGNLDEPVPAQLKTFPGGTNYTFVSHDALPKDLAKIPFRRRTTPADVATFDRLNFFTPSTSLFRYTYTTGPGTGANATCTITAEADLDPSTPEAHTRTQTVTVNSSMIPIVGPVVVTNELE